MKKMAALTVALWLGLVLLAQAQTPQAGTGRYDVQIQQAVTKLLASKDKWKGITASTDDAIVTLQGTTKMLIDKLDAAKKVDKVEHVQGCATTWKSRATFPISSLSASSPTGCVTTVSATASCLTPWRYSW